MMYGALFITVGPNIILQALEILWYWNNRLYQNTTIYPVGDNNVLIVRLKPSCLLVCCCDIRLYCSPLIQIQLL